MTVDIETLRQLERSATPGPWIEGIKKRGGTNNVPYEYEPIAYTAPGQGVFYNCMDEAHSGGSFPSADQRFIAAARNAMPQLLDRIVALEAALLESVKLHRYATIGYDELNPPTIEEFGRAAAIIRHALDGGPNCS